MGERVQQDVGYTVKLQDLITPQNLKVSGVSDVWSQVSRGSYHRTD